MVSELYRSSCMEILNPSSSSAIHSHEEFSYSLYLHQGDGPRSILVSQPLIGENYNSWG
jgi:hypothetical protein